LPDTGQAASAATDAQTKPAEERGGETPNPAPAAATEEQPPEQKAPTQVTISDGKLLKVPSLVGLPMRRVIEAAAAAGLNVEVHGNGTAREQAPAPGTLVPTGTKIVVKCER